MAKKPIVGHTPHYQKGIGVYYSEYLLKDGRMAMILACGVLDKDGTFYQWPDQPYSECFHAKVRVVNFETGKPIIVYTPISFIDWDGPSVCVTWR